MTTDRRSQDDVEELAARLLVPCWGARKTYWGAEEMRANVAMAFDMARAFVVERDRRRT